MTQQQVDYCAFREEYIQLRRGRQGLQRQQALLLAFFCSPLPITTFVDFLSYLIGISNSLFQLKEGIKVTLIITTKMIRNVNFVDDDDCPICCTSMQDKFVSVTPCGHHFHTECLYTQFGTQTSNNLLCAICRTDLQQSLPEEFQQRFVQPSLSTHLDNIHQRWGSELVDLLIDMPSDSRGARRTQLLLTRFVLSEDQNGRDMHLSSMDRENLHRMLCEGQSILGHDDNERISEFVDLANTVNRNFREGRHQQRVSEVDVPTFRDLSDFLVDSDSSPTIAYSERDNNFSISSRVRSLWNSLFTYGYTRTHESIQSPMRQSDIDRRLVYGVPRREEADPVPWYRFGC